NAARAVKAPKLSAAQALPFDEEEEARILAAIDAYPKKNSFGYNNRKRLRALVLLMRHAGLRIGDAVQFDHSKLDDSRLFLRTHKTGTTVYVPLPDFVVRELRDLPESPFWTGNGHLKSAVSHWQRVLPRIFKMAGVEGGYAHRFRHTFAVRLLEHGCPIE